MEKTYYIYILTSEYGRLYVGMTNNLHRRIWEHKHGMVEGYTKWHKIHRLVYFEETTNVLTAIKRETQIKRWRRDKKLALIKVENPTFKDLSEGWFEEENL